MAALSVVVGRRCGVTNAAVAGAEVTVAQATQQASSSSSRRHAIVWARREFSGEAAVWRGWVQYGRCSFIAAYYTLAFDRLELRGASGDNADTPEGVRGSWIACRFRSRNGPGSDEREGVLSRTHSRLLCCRVAITEHDYCRTWCAGHKFSNNLRKWHRTGFVYLLKWVPGPLSM